MKITYVGHATVIVESEECKFIVDPLFTKRPGRVGPRRRVKLKLEDDALEDIDFVLITHGHFDHLDKRSLCMIPGDGPVVSHNSLTGIVHRSCDKQTIGVDWWEEVNIKGISVSAVPSLHFSARPPLHYRRDYQGYVVKSEMTVYHAGDCGLSEYFEQIGKRFKIDIAMLPIGAYHPPSFRKHHLAPEDALDALEILEAKYLVPIHWGTYVLSREPFDEPPRRLREHANKRGLKDRVKILQPGGSIIF
jgi:L-ascorbate metabolism protein UlaG (beta-lactamase superfamily)